MPVILIPKKLSPGINHIVVTKSKIIQKIIARKTAVNLKTPRAMNVPEIVGLRRATALLIVFLQHPRFLNMFKII